MALGVLLVACSGGGGGTAGGPNTPMQPVTPTPVLTTVSVSLSAATVQPGQTDTARAAGFDQNGAPIGIGTPVWTTTPGAIATVNASGIVTGTAVG